MMYSTQNPTVRRHAAAAAAALAVPVVAALALLPPLPGQGLLEKLGRAPKAGSPAPQAALSLRRARITDAKMGGAVSHTVLVPDGWTLDARPYWTNNPATVVEFCGGIVGRDGEQVSFFPTLFVSFSDSPQIVRNMGGVKDGRLPGGTLFAAAPRGPGEAVQNVILPNVRPNARNIRVLHTEPIQEVNRMLGEMMAPVIRQAEQTNAMVRQSGGGSIAHHWYMAERVIVAYEENGESYEEEFHITQMGTTSHMSGMGFGPDFSAQDWRVLPFRSGRAKKGRLRRTMPLLATLSMSLRETPKWHNAVQQIRMTISRRQHEGRMAQLRAMRDASTKIAKTYSDISDMRHDSWKKQQASSDRSQRAFVNSIGGVDDYRLPDGRTVSLNSNYRHVYTDGNDRFVFTDDPNLQLNTMPGFNDVEWQAIRAVRPAGGAGR